MAKDIKTYYEQAYIDNTLRLREVLRELPPFVRDYFRAIEPSTSAKTRISYAYDLRVFFNFLIENNPVFRAYTLDQFKGITLGKLYEFLAFLQSDLNVSARSRMRKISSIRGFYKHLMTQKLISENPSLDLRLPLTLHYAVGYSVKEVAKILSLPETTISWRLRAARKKLRTELS